MVNICPTQFFTYIFLTLFNLHNHFFKEIGTLSLINLSHCYMPSPYPLILLKENDYVNWRRECNWTKLLKDPLLLCHLRRPNYKRFKIESNLFIIIFSKLFTRRKRNRFTCVLKKWFLLSLNLSI